MTNTLPWVATRYGMSCRISMADFLARLDDGAEQINETTYLWNEWVIRPVRNETVGSVVGTLPGEAVDLDALVAA